MTMPAGTYYVGDLCYILEKEWDEVCYTTMGSHGEFELDDGRKFVLLYTDCGDGEYFDQRNRSYLVDSGTIGCIKVSQRQAKAILAKQLGQIVKFEAPFECSSTGGDLVFGDVVINTAEEWED